MSKSEQNLSSNIESTKKAGDILEIPWQGLLLLIINSRILLLKSSLKLNVAKYFNDLRRPSSPLATFMFRGTPAVYEANLCEHIKHGVPVHINYIVPVGGLVVHEELNGGHGLHLVQLPKKLIVLWNNHS